MYISIPEKLLLDIAVSLAPKDISSSDQKVTYTDKNSHALLNCTVIAYPAGGSLAVTVKHEGVRIGSEKVNVTAIQKPMDGFLIEVVFDIVTADDFGIYNVTLNNGVADDVVISLNLHERGKIRI